MLYLSAWLQERNSSPEGCTNILKHAVASGGTREHGADGVGDRAASGLLREAVRQVRARRQDNPADVELGSVLFQHAVVHLPQARWLRRPEFLPADRLSPARHVPGTRRRLPRLAHWRRIRC